MPFFVGDYLSATTRLTTEQHGAYVLLLLDYWKNGPPPNDDAVLAQIARMSASVWRKARPALIGFFDVQNGQLIQKRVERERQRAAENVEKRSKAGKASAAARADKQQTSNKKSTHVETHVEANGQQNGRPLPSPSPCSNEQVISSNEDLSAEPTDAPVTEDEVLEAWQDRMVPLGYAAIRKLTPERRRRLKARIREYPDLDDWQRAFSALERSTFLKGDNDRGWRADFDFLLQPKSFTKLLEGSYDH
jgi:uncharacterized protein YdaU (DUF1376 family)